MEVKSPNVYKLQHFTKNKQPYIKMNDINKKH